MAAYEMAYDRQQGQQARLTSIQARTHHPADLLGLPRPPHRPLNPGGLTRLRLGRGTGIHALPSAWVGVRKVF